MNPAGSNTPFSSGDLLLIIQMQDSTGTLEGNFEYARVASVSGGTVTLASGLTNTYAQSISATSLRTYQIIRVPQYSSATIGNVTVPPWTLTNAGAGSGGVFVVDVAGTLSINGTINANGKGFRGAYGIQGAGQQAGAVFNTADYTPNLADISGALKGEGTNGVPNRVFTGVSTATTYTDGLYAAGTAGQGANGNAGGGGNDGNPPTSNSANSGGGGGGNAGAGGNGGNSWTNNNEAGGRGGLLQSNGAAKLYFGGGGGAGTMNNNGDLSAITAYPPTAPVVPNTGSDIPNSNGAVGEVTASGGAGGGIVILRASRVAYTSGGIQANGIDAYTVTSTDSSGGGGAGGSVIVQAVSSTGSLPISAVGGRGGDSGYFDHGPGGGGGGGFIGTTGVTTTSTTAGGVNGLDANNDGLSPSPYGSTTGGTGIINSSFATPPTGAAALNACLPNISVVKATSTPTISASGATTATYTITATNTSAGFAIGSDLVDNTLPPGWTFAGTTSITFAPPLSTTVLGGFVEGGTPGTPAVANSPGTAANLTVNGAPVAAPVWSNITIPGNGTATLTYTVNIPASASVGTFHNPAGVKYLDPTRSTAAREVTANTNNTANRAGAQVGGTTNITYETGSVAGTNVLGSNYSGLDGGAAGENVTLQADLSVLKTNSGTFSPASTAAGGTYTIAVSNVGRAVQNLTYAGDQATPATVSALLGAPYTVVDTLPAGMTLASAPVVTGTEAANWACTGVAGDASFTCTRNAGAGNIAAGNVTPVAMVSISAPVRVSLASCPGPLSNTAVLSNATIGEIVTTDNTSAVSTIMNCGASMVIAKTDNKATTSSGSTNNYVITLTNNGPSAGDGTVITDTVGAGLSCPASNVVTCTVLAGGAVCPAGPLTIANLTGVGVTIPTLPVTGSLQFSYACTTN